MNARLGIKKVKWNFFNNGIRFQFDPAKKVQGFNNSPSTMKEVHLELVRNAKSPRVFLLNELGEEVV